MSVVAFEVGKTYSTRSACDHECIFRITVAKRTAKTITTDKGAVLRIGIYSGAEEVYPRGRYSMAPVINATKLDKGDAIDVPPATH